MRDNVDRQYCFDCLRSMISSALQVGRVSSLAPEFTVLDIRELLTKPEFERYLEASLTELLDADERFTKCPACDVAVEVVRSNIENAEEDDSASHQVDLPNFGHLV